MLDLESLKMFGDVVRAGSLTRASQELYLSKSMLKKHVDGLERELGVTLLRRRCAAAERESGSRTLRVANFSDYVFQITNYYMDAYLERHPSDTIVPVFIPYAEVFSGLRKGLFDVAVAVRPPSEESQGILSTTLYAMRMCGLVSTASPLAEKAVLTREDLASSHVVMHPFAARESRASVTVLGLRRRR